MKGDFEMKHKVSVIIPVYNGEKYLVKCLNSIMSQIMDIYELILVDNNSTDQTKEVINTYVRKSKKVRYLFEKQRSRGAARNTGEKEAKGNIILMTDVDCEVPKQWVKEMILPIVKESYDAVQGCETNAENNYWSKQAQLRAEEKINTSNIKNIIGLIDTKNFAIKSDTLKKIGYTDRRNLRGNDTDLSIRLQRLGVKSYFSFKTKVLHNHPSTFSKVAKKYYEGGTWCSIISKRNIEYLKTTDFLHSTGQTFWSFTKFFPGLVKTVLTRGFGYAYYDLIVGWNWRLGLINGRLK